MIRLVPEPAPGAASALRSVLARTAAEEELPRWAAVEDAAGAWRAASLAEPPGTRHLAFVASPRGAADAARLGFAAAVRLPPATVDVQAALRAARERPPVPDVEDDEVVALLPGDITALAPAPLAVWRRLLGQRWLRAVLADVGRRCGRPWVLVRGPALVVAAAPNDLRAAWATTHLPQPPPWPVVRALEPRAPLPDLDALRREAREVGTVPAGGLWQLPRGVRLGAWRAAGDGAPEDVVLVEGLGWRLGGPAGPAIPESADAGSLAALAAGGAAAVRLPGFVAGDIGRAGTPGELVLDELAPAAAAAGLPLWVPQADHAVVRRLLALGISAWVDGPGAPGD